ncbi:MAG TPA: phosphoadenosine phosphosulfate reductase family protein [Patescibacteria group bacterium]|nr:phosphoadenosine phosphosulfate reductase family protein [Patescibacteria group bacterium]
MREIEIFNKEISGRLNSNLKSKNAEILLAYGIAFARENNLTPVATTSGGEYSAILMNFVRVSTKMPVIFIDMGPACYTYDTRHNMISEFFKMGLPVQTRFSKIASSNRPPTKSELDLFYGSSWRDPETTEYENAMRALKITPCRNALREIIRENSSNGVFLIRGIRQDADISGRDNIDWLSEHDYGVVLHPIADWTKEDADNYISEHKLPRNKNHLDPSRGRINGDGVINISYPDGTIYSASHTVCVLDNTIEAKSSKRN